MTLQDAIDNAPPWARWLAIDSDGLCACYFKTEPELFNGIYITNYRGDQHMSLRVRGEDGPQLIEVNK